MKFNLVLSAAVCASCVVYNAVGEVGGTSCEGFAAFAPCLRETLRSELDQQKSGRWLTIFAVQAREQVNVEQEWENAFKRSLKGFGSSIEQLRVSMRSGESVHYVTFRTPLLSATSWFRAANVVQSSYTDLTPGATYNVFAVHFEDVNARRLFYINRNYGGCPNDVGWMAIGTDKTICPWERRGIATYPKMRFMMCPGSTACNWQNDGIAAEEFIIEAFLT